MTLQLTPTFLGFLILICLLGLFSNIYAANYMRNNFDLSKTIYTTLFRCCLIYTIGFLGSIITEFYILNGCNNEFICFLFEISLSTPFFIVQSFILQMSILRCIMKCSKKSAKELINLQRTVAALMTPLPFAYLGTFYIVILANDKSLGLGPNLVSIKVICNKRLYFCGGNKYPPYLNHHFMWSGI